MKREARMMIEEVSESVWGEDSTGEDYTCPQGEAVFDWGVKGGSVTVVMPGRSWLCKGSNFDLLAEFAARALRPDLFDWVGGVWPPNFIAVTSDEADVVMETPEPKTQRTAAAVKKIAAEPTERCWFHNLSHEAGKGCVFCRIDAKKGIVHIKPQQAEGWWSN